jgi:putative redox protein
MYAGRKGWPLRSAKVFLTHQKNYATDCEHCEDKSARIDEFKRIIELEGITDEKQRSRLMEIADKCPVHKTLLSDINVKTELR